MRVWSHSARCNTPSNSNDSAEPTSLQIKPIPTDSPVFFFGLQQKESKAACDSTKICLIADSKHRAPRLRFQAFILFRWSFIIITPGYSPFAVHAPGLRRVEQKFAGAPCLERGWIGLHVVPAAHGVVVCLLLCLRDLNGDLGDEALSGEHQRRHTGAVLHSVDRYLHRSVYFARGGWGRNKLSGHVYVPRGPADDNHTTCCTF